MSKGIAALLVIAVLGSSSLALATPARPCGMGGSNAENRKLAVCLSRLPGFHVPGGARKAVSVGNCESGFDAGADTGNPGQVTDIARQALSQLNQGEEKPA